jgi:hypothetical protein
MRRDGRSIPSIETVIARAWKIFDPELSDRVKHVSVWQLCRVREAVFATSISDSTASEQMRCKVLFSESIQSEAVAVPWSTFSPVHLTPAPYDFLELLILVLA